VLGTIEDVVDDLRDEGVSIGAVGLKCFRPYPLEEVRAALAAAERVVVLEKAFAVGAGGIVGQNVRLALWGLPPRVHDVVAGLGGRPITKASLRGVPVRTPRASCARSAPSPRGRSDGGTRDQVLPDRQLRRRRPAARSRAPVGPGGHRPLQHADVRASRVSGLWRGARRALRA
jgi:hypothetical protein